ncbi:MAG: LD-carboxypeptidase [Candidatus Nanoarchaeia archaeon]|nr:LD-carboxypeptidase [Candidatus Nanoarchaeia archaeon]
MFPDKLKKGDEIRIIAPSRSLSLISEENIKFAKSRLESMGFKVTFSKNCRESDMFISSSINSRVQDIHEAFADKNVKAIFTVIGGFNSNQLLKYLDYNLIKKNPKILCGYSDFTAFANAITAKTELVTYYGPHFSTWSMKKEFDYILEYFKKCLMSNEEFEVKSSLSWSDDTWYKDQENRIVEKNEGLIVINPGKAEGKILGGNLCTFNLLQGTEFFHNLKNSILFIEDDDMPKEGFDVEFDRDLQSLIHQQGFEKVKGLVIGRFQKKAEMNMDKLRYILSTKEELKNIPIIANADFGHTYPICTLPLGGTAEIEANKKAVIRIINH